MYVILVIINTISSFELSDSSINFLLVKLLLSCNLHFCFFIFSLSHVWLILPEKQTRNCFSEFIFKYVYLLFKYFRRRTIICWLLLFFFLVLMVFNRLEIQVPFRYILDSDHVKPCFLRIFRILQNSWDQLA